MKDPICGMMVDEAKTQFKSEHDGKSFFFCSAHCKMNFDRDPSKYSHAT